MNTTLETKNIIDESVDKVETPDQVEEESDSEEEEEFTVVLNRKDRPKPKPTTPVKPNPVKPKLNIAEFPALGSKPLSKKQLRDHRFIVASSRIDELRQSRPRPVQQQRNFTSLKCTKACLNVTTKTEDGKYGVCTRPICTFAHSLDELKDPECQFGANCRFIHGRYDRHTGKMDKRHKCGFKHPHEDRDQYYARTNKETPDLPATSEHTRKPKSPPVQFVHKPLVHKLNRPPPKLAEQAEQVIRVPKAMYEKTLKMFMESGMTTSIKIETF